MELYASPFDPQFWCLGQDLKFPILISSKHLNYSHFSLGHYHLLHAVAHWIGFDS